MKPILNFYNKSIPSNKKLMWEIDNEQIFIDYDVLIVDSDTKKEIKGIFFTCKFLSGNHVFKYLNFKKDLFKENEDLNFLSQIPNKYDVDFKWEYSPEPHIWSLSINNKKIIIDNEDDISFLIQLLEYEDNINYIGYSTLYKEYYQNTLEKYMSILDRYI